ncbi:MAG: hypothetical protein FD546_000102 [Pelagibacterales bacterium]|nr:hypothetical protein [Pelagibacterales bacterium]
MHDPLKQLYLIKNKVNDIISKKKSEKIPNIIVVTKTFPLNKIIPILDSGHLHFGENKVQEAEKKWYETKNNYQNIKLHMVGKLQSNKAKKAVEIFDYIHSLDSKKLAQKIAEQEKLQNKKVKIFIQVNIGKEIQKAGVELHELSTFYKYCSKDLSLNIVGLMCLPPINSNDQKYFKTLKEVADNLNLNELSMGMSSDYESAILNGSTYLRLGTVIMGRRELPN